jgi:hypothetical protein
MIIGSCILSNIDILVNSAFPRLLCIMSNWRHPPSFIRYFPVLTARWIYYRLIAFSKNFRISITNWPSSIWKHAKKTQVTRLQRKLKLSSTLSNLLSCLRSKSPIDVRMCARSSSSQDIVTIAYHLSPRGSMILPIIGYMTLETRKIVSLFRLPLRIEKHDDVLNIWLWNWHDYRCPTP